MVYIILAAVLVLVLAWNFYPPFRAKMRGFSTIAEAAIGAALAYFGVFAEAIREAELGGFLPDNLQQWAPFVLLAWVVAKRVQTKTAIGQSNEGAV